MNFNTTHPERRSGEVFVTNATPGQLRRVGWSTKRIGQVAYGPTGVKLGNRAPGMVPVFAQRAEIAHKKPAILKLMEP